MCQRGSKYTIQHDMFFSLHNFSNDYRVYIRGLILLMNVTQVFGYLSLPRSCVCSSINCVIMSALGICHVNQPSLTQTTTNCPIFNTKVYVSPLQSGHLKKKKFHVRKGSKYDCEPNFHETTTSNVGNYPILLKMAQFLTEGNGEPS